jgi:hypothetical protein
MIIILYDYTTQGLQNSHGTVRDITERNECFIGYKV